MTTLLRSNCCSQSNNGEGSTRREIYYQIALASESEIESNDESTESIFSMQADATVSAKDSSDITTCTEVEFSREAEFSSEYEIASSPRRSIKHPWSFHQSNSSGSSPSKSVPNVLPTQNLSTTSKSSNCDITSDDGENDRAKTNTYHILYRFKYCAMCTKLNECPSFPFCRSCFKIKKEFFPEKPRAKKKRKSKCGSPNIDQTKKRKKIDPIDSTKPTTSELFNKKQSTNSSDENSSEENCVDSQEMIFANSRGTVSVDSGFKSQTNSDGSQDLTLDPDDTNDKKCVICLKDERNAAFIHGKIGHLGCCYGCAKKIWYDSARCPICRRKVSNVIRVM